MANLIDISFFFGNLHIAQKSDAAVSSSLNWFIDEYEPRLLTDLLGYELYEAYKTGIAAGSPDAKWTDLRDGKAYTNRAGITVKYQGLKWSIGGSKKSPIANYVYWYWMENQVSDSTGTGEKVTDAQASAGVSPATKMIRAWNQMADWNRELLEFLLSNETDYPEFTDHYSRIPAGLIKYQNSFGI